MPCNPVDLPLPSGPSGPAVPGFGIPFAPKLPKLINIPDGFPEDLLDLFNKFQMLIPPGILKPTISYNYGKDIFDSIMTLLDQFFPILMLYKFFLPVLNLIICIIEVICSLNNPFKVIRAMRRLFRNCLPDFLNLFPIFALIVMIISLLLLLLALIEYIISQILKLIQALLRNINALDKAFSEGNQNSILSIAKKIGSLLCVFQNLFVLLALFGIILGIIKDILALTFSIPPCENDNGVDSDDNCCSTDVCPAIVQNQYTRVTGDLQYLSQVAIQTTLSLPPPLPNFNIDLRSESWQIFDDNQELAQQFINIVDGYDVTVSPKPIFFAMDATYNATTDPRQACYTVDLRLFYNPANWGRTGDSKFIRFKDCIVTFAPTRELIQFDNTEITHNNGVLKLAGGKGFEDDNSTILTGFAEDGITPISDQATLENFVHKPEHVSISPVLPNDGYTFQNVEYTFKPNIAALFNKNIVTAGCEPSLALNRTFINTVFAGDAALKTTLLRDLVNGGNFPDPAGTQECLSTALAALRSNLTATGVAQFQATTTICLNKLKDDSHNALKGLMGLGFDACSSTFTINPEVQFTSKPIEIKVDLKDKNKASLAIGLPVEVSSDLASRISGHATFGGISTFQYDGYQFFLANITSSQPGKGQLMISFDNNIFCTNVIPQDNAIPPSHDLQTVDYQFVYTPVGPFSATTNLPSTGTGDTTDGAPRRDNMDPSNSGKDGS